MEAVQAAKSQNLAASEQLDRALRVALFAESRCISMLHVVLDLAKQCTHVDAVALEAQLHRGTARGAVLEPPPARVKGSPHLFLPDGSDAANPGIAMHCVGDHGTGFPVVDGDDPNVYEGLLRRAAA